MNIQLCLSPKDCKTLYKLIHLRGDVTPLFENLDRANLDLVDPFSYGDEIVQSIWLISRDLFDQMRADGCFNCFQLGSNYYWQRLDSGAEAYPDSLTRLAKRFGENPLAPVL